MKNTFKPANDTLAVMALRPTTEPVAKLVISQDCILLTLIVSIVRGVLTPCHESHISLKAGQTVYFVASNEREGYSYIVFLYADGSSLCSCKEGCNHRTCQHVADAASYEARCAEVEEHIQRSKAGKKSGKTTPNLLERKVLGNGTTLYIFQSESDPDYRYYITANSGGIDTSTHEDCPGFYHHRHCCHMDAVSAAELSAYEARMAAKQARSEAFYRAYTSSAYYQQTYGKLA